MSIQERLDEFISFKGLDRKSFEIKSELSNGFVSKVGRSMHVNSLNKIQESFPDLNKDWLITGHGKILLNTSELTLSEPEVEYKTKLQRNISVPVYDVEFSAGFITSLVESREDHYPIGYLSIPQVAGCDAIIKARGDSMADRINDGDWIGIKRLENWQEWFPMGYIYAIITDHMELIKYLKKGTSADTFTIVSHNKFYDDDQIPKHLIKEIWSVKSVLPFGKIETFI